MSTTPLVPTAFYIKSKHIDELAVLQFQSYMADSSIAMLLNSAATGEHLAVATVCLAQFKFKPDVERCEVFIKTWGENTGLFQALIDAKIIIDWHRRIEINTACIVAVGRLTPAAATICVEQYNQQDAQRRRGKGKNKDKGSADGEE